MKRARKRTQVHQAPLAVTTDGDVLLNVTSLTAASGVEDLIVAALRNEGTVFVGIVLGERDAAFALERLDNTAAETAARIVGRRQRARRTTRT